MAVVLCSLYLKGLVIWMSAVGLLYKPWILSWPWEHQNALKVVLTLMWAPTPSAHGYRNSIYDQGWKYNAHLRCPTAGWQTWMEKLDDCEDHCARHGSLQSVGIHYRKVSRGIPLGTLAAKRIMKMWSCCSAGSGPCDKRLGKYLLLFCCYCQVCQTYCVPEPSDIPVCRSAELAISEEDGIEDHPSQLFVHRSMKTEGMHPRVMGDLANITARLFCHPWKVMATWWKGGPW